WLADDVVVLPAHCAGAAEIGAGGVVSALLGDLRRSPEMKIEGVPGFVAAMKAAVGEPPRAYADIVRANLGLESPSSGKIEEWELGKNECAASKVRGR